jgi:hypothetical protein
VSQFPVAIGEAKLIHNVQIHKYDSLTDVHLAIAWESTSNEHWYIISTEPTTLQTFREYGFRLLTLNPSKLLLHNISKKPIALSLKPLLTFGLIRLFSVNQLPRF